MSFLKIAWRNMQQRALASSLTGLSMALGVALMILVLVIHAVVVDQLKSDAQGYHFVIGTGQGSKFEIVLSTVFHIGTPLNVIPYSYYKKFTEGEFAPYVSVAVPICLGDSYVADDGQQFRVVASTPEIFDELSYGAYEDGEPKLYQFSSGRNFRSENFFEAVLGSVAANRTGLGVGDRFQPTHGLSSGGDKHDEFEIVGVLEPTGTANDRAMFINTEGFYLLEGHALSPKQEPAANGAEASRVDANNSDPNSAASSAAGAADSSAPPLDDHNGPPVAHEHSDNRQAEPLPEAQREVTSILVLLKEDTPDSPLYSQIIDQAVNKSEDRTAQAVSPGNVVQRLMENFLAPIQLILLVLTVMIVVVAGISILVSIYNSMSERGHDIAVMRALGASRGAVMAIVLLESILLSILGGLAGIALGHGIIALASPVVEYYTGVIVRPFDFSPMEWTLVPCLVAFAALVGFLPALTAYRTDVAKTLGGTW